MCQIILYLLTDIASYIGSIMLLYHMIKMNFMIKLCDVFISFDFMFSFSLFYLHCSLSVNLITPSVTNYFLKTFLTWSSKKLTLKQLSFIMVLIYFIQSLFIQITSVIYSIYLNCGFVIKTLIVLNLIIKFPSLLCRVL